ncbi:hypothetical protein DW1_1148 [Proteiniborus sp. DW1]|uniref:hypothetical protein n=1 Tax=Proteiniborus sp. DW1 TaxID=1889883 RepID=UPI00092E06EA|nr:hypothetical protein [Proteiniborus sp. DW1]SCG82721.1 hypothetical protein DW1_1148 [Proteiniborus sp. DW1]
MDKYHVLEKYNLEKKIEKEYELKTKNHRGATDLITRFRICKKHINEKQVEIRNDLDKLQRETECFKLSEIPNPEGLKHTNCYFWYIKNIDSICESCEFYNSVLKELQESISELSKAADDFLKAEYDEYWDA